MNIITKARDLMAERGLAKWTQEKPDGRVCVAGAISIAQRGRAYAEFDQESERAMRVLDEVAEEQFPERCKHWQQSAVNFNNHDATTLEEMLQVMDKAAVRLDELV